MKLHELRALLISSLKKVDQFNEEIKPLKADFDVKSDLLEQQFTINSIAESYPS
ncbi:MAG: hypothetical protein ACJA0U_000469 [Salibacteraceae bacterium]